MEKFSCAGLLVQTQELPDADGRAEEAGPLDGAEVEEGLGAGLNEFDGEAKGEVGGEEEAEKLAIGAGAAGVEEEGDAQDDEEQCFVKLSGMTGNLIAEFDGPGE